MMPPQLRSFVDVVELADLHHVAAVLQAARHAARLHLESGGVGDDGLLEADLRAVGEAGHHRRVLAPALGKALLRGGIAIGILQPFDVAHDARDEPEALDPAIQIHLHAGLVAFARRQDDAVLFGVDLQNRADRRVDLGVHQHDVLAVLESLEDDARPEFDRAGHVHQHVDLLGARQQEGVFGDDRLAGADGILHLALRGGRDGVLAAGVGEHVEARCAAPVVDRHHAHPGDAVHDLIGEPLPHEAGADNGDSDRPALRFPGLQCGVDDDHVASSSSCPLEAHAPLQFGFLGVERRPGLVLLRDHGDRQRPRAVRGGDRCRAARPRSRVYRTRPPDSSSRSCPRAPGSRARSAPARRARDGCPRSARRRRAGGRWGFPGGDRR